MGLFIRQDDNRTELQERLAAELREKARARAEHDNKPADLVNDSNYMKDTKNTSSLAWLWILIIAAAIVVMVWLMIAGK